MIGKKDLEILENFGKNGKFENCTSDTNGHWNNGCICMRDKVQMHSYPNEINKQHNNGMNYTSL